MFSTALPLPHIPHLQTRLRTRTTHGETKSGWLSQLARLKDQEEGISIPSFGRNAIICGKLEFSSLEGIQCVEVELEGQLKLAIAEGGN
ncbi:hypothetical protein DFH11DRAFT_1726928 [Phellopilus nigrolimitatus]|nr:hypothetical protein DFH11DRAFT_1726928 [Phellopilus nigrolimitatus]